MLKPEKNFLITGFLNWYISWIVKRNFNAVNFNRVELDKNKAVLLLANHHSWWDGFLLYHINQIYFKKTFKAMVLKDTMKNVGFFKYIGGFSITKNSRQMLESLSYAAGLLNDPQNMLVIFPQGKLYSNFVDEVKFEKGVFKIIDLATADFQYLFATAFTENFDHKKPTANISFKIVDKATIASADDLQSAYQQHYNLTKQHQTQIVV